MQKIDLNDWQLNGAGGFGSSYFHKTNPSLMLKIMAPDADIAVIQKELDNAHMAWNLGVVTPRPGELVTDGEKVGIMFERIQGKVSYARAVGDTPEQIPFLAGEYTRMVNDLHGLHKCEGMSDVREIYGKDIKDNKFRSDAFKNRALDLLYSLPVADTCLHGDMHFGNIILAGGKSYIIDLADFSYGNPNFDFTMMRILMDFGKYCPDIFQREYHCTTQQAEEFWKLVLQKTFGEDVDVAKKEEELKPYRAIRTLVIETLFGQPTIPQIEGEMIEYFG